MYYTHWAEARRAWELVFSEKEAGAAEVPILLYVWDAGDFRSRHENDSLLRSLANCSVVLWQPQRSLQAQPHCWKGVTRCCPNLVRTRHSTDDQATFFYKVCLS